MPFTIASDGYFHQDGRRFVPFGANWWPGSCGVELWRRWPEDEIRRDFDLLRALGMNSLRFFLRWQDFEPEPGRYDRRCFERLDLLLRWCGERGIAANPSLFVGWMSGATFWPGWKAGRNLFADAGVSERSYAFAREAAAVLRPHHANILCVDQGNELDCVSDSRAAPPAAVHAWCAGLNAAIHETYPEALIISGQEHNQVCADTGWRLGEQPGCDLLSMHVYPVPTWHSLRFDGMTDPLAQSLLPFYVALARAHGPAFLQEFGTIVTFGAREQDAFLRALLPAAWEAGANGFLWWCLRDIVAPIVPYLTCGFEATLGLVDAEGRVKPGLEAYLEFGRSLATRPAPARASGGVGIYWPRAYYPRDNPDNAGNEPESSSRRLGIANHLVRAAGRRTRVVRGDQPLPTDLDALLVPSVNLRADEAAALGDWVAGGGKLIWHGPDPINTGPAYIRLLGAKPVDYRAPLRVDFSAHGGTWSCGAWPRGMRCAMEPAGCEVLARDQRGLPTLTRHRLGAGVTVAAYPQIEDEPAALAGDREARERWVAWYAGQLEAVGASRG
jgi:hypothetical protein